MNYLNILYLWFNDYRILRTLLVVINSWSVCNPFWNQRSPYIWMTSISFAVCAYLYGCAMEMSLDGIDSLQSPVNDLFSDIGFSVAGCLALKLNCPIKTALFSTSSSWFLIKIHACLAENLIWCHYRIFCLYFCWLSIHLPPFQYSSKSNSIYLEISEWGTVRWTVGFTSKFAWIL